MAITCWAEKPLALIETPSKTMNVNEHGSIYIANEMAFAHNAMLRGINSIYLQAAGVREPQDITDFLFFVKSWSGWIMHHHRLEETMMFPSFEEVMGKPGSMQANVEQHQFFELGLRELNSYASNTKTEDYRSETIMAIIDGFSAGLREHLHEEIKTLLEMRPYDSRRLLKAYKQAELAARDQEKMVVPPMVLGLCDKTFQGGNNWPALPSMIPYVIHYILRRKHAGAWRFLPCDSWGMPRPSAFIQEQEF